MAKDIVSVLEYGLEKLASFNMVIELSRKDVSDYDRGKVAGRIEAFQWALNELASVEVEDETHNSK